MKLLLFRLLLVAVISAELFVGIRQYKNLNPHIKAPTSRYPASPVFQKAIQDMKRLTVLISVEDFGGWERGTGVLLDATHVLTCAHVVHSKGNNILVYFYPGYVLAHGHVLYMDPSNDLAVVGIDVPAYTAHYAKFTMEHYDGEPIVAIGNALGGLQWFVTYGIVSGNNERDLFSDRFIMAGDSGGPWIDSQGRIVAISAWGLQGGSGIDGGIASHTVYEFLEAYLSTLPKEELPGSAYKHEKIIIGEKK